MFECFSCKKWEHPPVLGVLFTLLRIANGKYSPSSPPPLPPPAGLTHRSSRCLGEKATALCIKKVPESFDSQESDTLFGILKLLFVGALKWLAKCRDYFQPGTVRQIKPAMQPACQWTILSYIIAKCSVLPFIEPLVLRLNKLCYFWILTKNSFNKSAHSLRTLSQTDPLN
jgi:hypothetical protein